MRIINVVVEDKEHDKLVKLKGQRNWRRFILDISGITSGKTTTHQEDEAKTSKQAN